MEATIITRVAAITITAVQSATDGWIDQVPRTGSNVLLLLILLYMSLFEEQIASSVDYIFVCLSLCFYHET